MNSTTKTAKRTGLTYALWDSVTLWALLWLVTTAAVGGTGTWTAEVAVVQLVSCCLTFANCYRYWFVKP